MVAGTRPFTKVVTFLSSTHREFMVYILYTSHVLKELKPEIRTGVIFFKFDYGLIKYLIIVLLFNCNFLTDKEI